MVLEYLYPLDVQQTGIRAYRSRKIDAIDIGPHTRLERGGKVILSDSADEARQG